jgi:HPt (histidine-containing phosphotransfer) domain-containing protein
MKIKAMHAPENIQLYDLTFLRQMLPNETDTVQMIEIFITSTPVIVADINEACQQRDDDKLAKNAHQLKPSLDLIGIVSLKEEIRKIDKLSKVQQLTDGELRTIVEYLNNVLRQVFDQLHEEFGQIEGATEL